MTRPELDEAIAVLNTVLSALLQTVTGKAGRVQSTVRAAIGSLQATAGTAIQAGKVGQPLYNCFDLARRAGASWQSMDQVVQTISALTFRGIPAEVIGIHAVFFCLIQESSIVAAIKFTSREDVDRMINVMNVNFDAPESFAADNIDDPSIYQAIVDLHANVMQLLISEARPLPRMVTYTLPKGMPSLALAQRLYQDPTRADELVAEGKIVHPLFCPATGRCLSQ